MAKSAVNLNGSSDVTLDNNTFDGNNRVAWRVFETADWLNDLKVGPWGPNVANKTASMESEALQDLLRLTKAEAEELGMDGILYDAAPEDAVYRDPRVYAAVRVATSTDVTIANNAFTNNHNSIAICGEYVCRVEGLEAVGADGDSGRAPAYISPNPELTGPRIDCQPERQPVQRQRHPQLRRARLGRQPPRDRLLPRRRDQQRGRRGGRRVHLRNRQRLLGQRRGRRHCRR